MRFYIDDCDCDDCKKARAFEKFMSGIQWSIEEINRMEKNKMAKQLIKQAELDLLYPNKVQQEAFLRVFGYAVEPDPVILYQENTLNCSIRLETWPDGLVLWVNGKVKYKYWEDNNK